VGGDYKNYNMTALNLTIVRDYVFYLALKSAGQGVGEEVTTLATATTIYAVYQQYSHLLACKFNSNVN
jgi:hypothetical protein